MLNNGNKILEIYEDENGRSPFIEWLESIRNIIIKARIKNRLRKIELGNIGDYKYLGDGIFELRLKFGPGFRIYFGRIDNRIILLLYGGDKNSQGKDIEKAKFYWRDYKINN